MRSARRIGVCVLAVTLMTAGRAAAQERAWLDVNFGVAKASEGTYTNSVAFDFRAETETVAAIYSLPTGASFDVGGGYMFLPRIGAGLSIAGTAHEDFADLSIDVPHPNTFFANASDTAATDVKLRRSEGSVNLQVMAIVTNPTSPLTVRVFGGPTYFRVRQDTVTDIAYLETLTVSNAFSVDITNFDLVKEVEANGWGAHFGADVRYFFTNRVGVGGIVRFSRATVDIDGILGDPTEIKVGGVQVGGGLRLKF